MTTAEATKNLMEIRDLQVHFALHETFKSRITGRGGRSVKAVDGVSLDLYEGEVLGLVGESGSGKTTLGRALLGLVRPTGGSVKLRGEELAGLPERQLRPKRRHLQMVFQDPHASLNPGMTPGDRARAPAADPQADQGRRRDQGEGPRGRWSWSTCRRSTSSPTACRATSPAVRSSARRSRGRSSPAPTWSSPTSRSRCST